MFYTLGKVTAENRVKNDPDLKISTFECLLSRKIFLHKNVFISQNSGKPVCKYELGIAFFGGDIVSFRGPLTELDMNDCEDDFSDLNLNCSKKMDPPGATITPSKSRDREDLIQRKIMSFSIVSDGYRHEMENHVFVMKSITVIVQLLIMTEVS